MTLPPFEGLNLFEQTQSVDREYEEIIKPFQKNSEVPVIKIDRNCAAGGQMANHNLKAIKQACFVYTQSPIPYKNENYHVSELLSVKAKIVAQCQRMLRENKFKTQQTVGEAIRFLDNENGFVINPLLEAKPITTPKIHLRPLKKKNSSTPKKKLNMDIKATMKANSTITSS